MKNLVFFAFGFIVLSSFHSCRSTDVQSRQDEDFPFYEEAVEEEELSVPVEQPRKSGKIDVPYTVIASGSYLPSILEGNKIVKSEAELHDLWSRLAGRENTKPPFIDFTKNIVIAVFAGQFSTGGFSIDLQSAEFTENTLCTVFSVKQPPEGTIVTQAFTQPFIVISVTMDITKNVLIELNRKK